MYTPSSSLRKFSLVKTFDTELPTHLSLTAKCIMTPVKKEGSGQMWNCLIRRMVTERVKSVL
jgi:hypothetical protein